MKNTIKIIAGAALLASFAACSQKIDFVSNDYARFDSMSYSFDETVGSVTIPVYANAGANGTVNFEVIENTAKTGVDFSVEGSSVTVSNGSCAGIVINIVSHEGELTGDLDFTIRLTKTSEGLGIGGIYETVVKIKDIDHPLTDLFGEYSFSNIISLYFGNLYLTNWTMTMSPVEGNLEQVSIDHISYFSVYDGDYTGAIPVIGTVSADKKTITINYPQETGNAYGETGIDEPFIFYGHEGMSGNNEYIQKAGTVTFTLQEDGRWLTEDSYGFSTPSDIKDYPDEFGYYSVVFSNYPGYPTFFVKK